MDLTAATLCCGSKQASAQLTDSQLAMMLLPSIAPASALFVAPLLCRTFAGMLLLRLAGEDALAIERDGVDYHAARKCHAGP